MISIISRVNVVKMEEQDKVNFGLGLSGVVGILAIILKILSKRVQRSSCFGVNVEMQNISSQVSDLQAIVERLTHENTELKNQLTMRRTSNASEMC